MEIICHSLTSPFSTDPAYHFVNLTKYENGLLSVRIPKSRKHLSEEMMFILYMLLESEIATSRMILDAFQNPHIPTTVLFSNGSDAYYIKALRRLKALHLIDTYSICENSLQFGVHFYMLTNNTRRWLTKYQSHFQNVFRNMENPHAVQLSAMQDAPLVPLRTCAKNAVYLKLITLYHEYIEHYTPARYSDNSLSAAYIASKSLKQVYLLPCSSDPSWIQTNSLFLLIKETIQSDPSTSNSALILCAETMSASARIYSTLLAEDLTFHQLYFITDSECRSSMQQMNVIQFTNDIQSDENYSMTYIPVSSLVN